MPSMGGSATLISAPRLGDLLDVDMSAKVDQSIPSWQAGAGKYEPLPGVVGDGAAGEKITGAITAGDATGVALQFHALHGETDLIGGQGVIDDLDITALMLLRGALAGDVYLNTAIVARHLQRNGHVISGAVLNADISYDTAGHGLVPAEELVFQTTSSDYGVGMSVNALGGVGHFGTTPPTAQPAITGALSTVADAAAKGVLTSIIAALVGCGLASDGTT